MSEAIERHKLSIAFSHRTAACRAKNNLKNQKHSHGEPMFMTQRRPSCQEPRATHSRISRTKVAGLVLVLMGALIVCPHAVAQTGGSLPKVNYILNARQAPGVVASAQIARGMPGAGTFQALSISGPSGLQVALAQDGQFLPSLDAPVTTAMLVGSVYRIRVTGIPFRPAEELYPTIEVIDRINAPLGREHRFPIPIVLTEEDLRLALDGALITRVVYLEDSEIAEPVALAPGTQWTLDVRPTDNALQTADRLGRPVAILRIGSRVPADLAGDLSHFLYGCPPWLPLPTVPSREPLVQAGQWPASLPVEPAEQPFAEPPDQDFPRTPPIQ